MSGKYAWAIAIPARDEAARIADCLTALGRQRDVAMTDGAILVLANNCTDDTARIARDCTPGCDLHVVEQTAPAGIASAGAARRVAMAHARAMVRPDAILLTTDADAIADDNWIAAMLAGFADRRIDCVAGAVSGNWDELRHHPQAALDIGALECRYNDLTVAVEDAIDPQDHDPAPRHGQECGANLGIRAAMFDAIGGVPQVPVGEDRALIAAVLCRDGRVRHATAPHVTASARTDGRAEGGMATALRERIAGTYVCDELVLPAAIVERRLRWRKAARAAFAEGMFADWAAHHALDGTTTPVQAAHFGTNWAHFVAHCPALTASPVSPAELPAQIARLEHLLGQRSDCHVA